MTNLGFRKELLEVKFIHKVLSERYAYYYIFCLHESFLDETPYCHILNYVGMEMLFIKVAVTQQSYIKQTVAKVATYNNCDIRELHHNKKNSSGCYVSNSDTTELD